MNSVRTHGVLQYSVFDITLNSENKEDQQIEED